MKLVKKFSKIAALCMFIAALSTSCETDDSSTPEQPIVPDNLSGQLDLSSYEIDFGSFQARATNSNLGAKQQDSDTTVVLTLTNGSDLIVNRLSSSINFDGGGAGVELRFSPLDPGASIDVPFTYKVTTTTPGTYTGQASLTPTFENDSIGAPLVVDLKATLE